MNGNHKRSPLVNPIDKAILSAIHEIDPTGKLVVYVPERDLGMREFMEVYGTIPRSVAVEPPQVKSHRDR
jgi:hypothetical protein